MAEDPRFLLHFKTLAKFKEKLADGTVSESRHLVFIKDEKLIWCRGIYYSDASKLDNFNNYYNDWEITQSDANIIKIKLKGNLWNSTTRKWEAISKELQLNSATGTIAGLMSALDKRQVDIIDTANFKLEDPTTTASTVTINASHTDVNGETRNLKTSKTINGASSTSAGVMTTDHYTLIYTTLPNSITNAVNALDSTVTSTDGTNVLVKVTETDGKITAVNITTDNTINNTNLTNAINALDADKSGTSTSGHVKVQVVETDGKVSSVVVTDSDIASATTLSNHTGNTSNPHSVTATQVGLGNVTNESKATMFTSPAFTGTPTAPTAATATNNTLVATTAFVKNAISDILTKLDGIASGAEVNVQSDWNETTTTSDAYIKNKPTSMPASDVYSWAKASTKPSYTAEEVGAIGSITASAGTNINSVGTPSVSASTTNNSTTLTFNYLKGAKGDAGDDGTSAEWFTGTAVTGTSSSITASVTGSKAGDMYLNTSNLNVYSATAANTWKYVCNIKGAKGDAGDDGEGISGDDYVLKAGDTMTGTLTIKKSRRESIIMGEAEDNSLTDDDYGFHIDAGTKGGKSLFLNTDKSNRIEIDSDGLITLDGGSGKNSLFNVDHKGYISFYSSDPAPVFGSNYAIYCGNGIYSEGTVRGGDFANASDIRLKDILDSNKSINIQDIANAPVITFKWKDLKKDNNIHLGTSALYWNDVLPEAVNTEYDGYFSMNYGNLGVASVITVAREVIKLQEEINQLKEDKKQLKEEVELLKQQVEKILTMVNIE